MYLRFVTPLRDRDSGAETGFFRAAWYLYETGCPDWIHYELRRQFDWFDAHLPLPGRTARCFKRRHAVRGVCWFRAEATACIHRAHYCAWLLSEGGVPVRLLKQRRLEEVMWRDEHQIVARPDASAPRAFGTDRFRLRYAH